MRLAMPSSPLALSMPPPLHANCSDSSGWHANLRPQALLLKVVRSPPGTLCCGDRAAGATTMGPKKESHQEKSLRYQQASANLALKADMTTCIAAMRASPDAVREVKRTLMNLGFLKDGEVVAAGASESGRAGSGQGSGAAAKEKGGCKKTCAPSIDPSTEAPKSPAEATPDVLQYILSSVEPVSLSLNALRGLLKGTQRKLPKGILLELHTFVFDCDDDVDWTSFGTLGKVVEFLAALNVQNGRRARDLQIPFTWAESGIYAAFISDGKLHLKSKFSGATVPVSLPGFDKVADIDQVAISKNFSAKQAALCLVGKFATVPCMQLLPIQATVAMPHKPMLAIDNGQLALGEPPAEDEEDDGDDSADPAAPLATPQIRQGGPPAEDGEDEAITTPAPKRRRAAQSPNPELLGSGGVSSSTAALARDLAQDAAAAEQNFSPAVRRTMRSKTSAKAAAR